MSRKPSDSSFLLHPSSFRQGDPGMRPGAAALLLAAFASPAAPAEETHLRYVPSDTRAVLSIHYPALPPAERGQARDLMDRLYRAHLVPELGKEARMPISDV